MNNWHRRFWKLSESGPIGGAELFVAGASNRFYLEPSAYVGPDVVIPSVGGVDPPHTYGANCLCFRVGVLTEDDVSSHWLGRVFFPAGSEPFTWIVSAVTGAKTPHLLNTTERLHSNIEVNMESRVLTLCLDPEFDPLGNPAEPELIVMLSGRHGEDGYLGGRGNP